MDDQKQGRCIGLVGGLGVGATVHYYTELARAHKAQGRALDMVTAHAETSRVFAYVEADDRDGLAEYLCAFISRLKAAGAVVAVVPAVTPHYCVRELIASSPLPLFNIFEPLRQEIAARALRRVAVFGSRSVMDSALFGELGDVEILRLQPEELDYVGQTYAELLRTGKGLEEQHQGLTALAHTLLGRDGADAVIFAGTDLTLLFNAGNTDFPYIDCAALHLAAITKGLLE